MFNFGTPNNSQRYQELTEGDDDIVTNNEDRKQLMNQVTTTFSFETPSPHHAQKRIWGAQRLQSGTIPIDLVSSSSTATPTPKFSPTMAEF
jgi:hypothetical protein